MSEKSEINYAPDSWAIINSVRANAAWTLTGKDSSSKALKAAWKCLLRISSEDHTRPCFVTVPKISRAYRRSNVVVRIKTTENARKITHDGPQERFWTLQLGTDELQHELLHIVLNLGVFHDLPSQGGSHVESTEPLLGWSVYAKNGVDEPKDWQERGFCPVCSKRKKEGRSCGDRGCKRFVFVCKEK